RGSSRRTDRCPARCARPAPPRGRNRGGRPPRGRSGPCDRRDARAPPPRLCRRGRERPVEISWRAVLAHIVSQPILGPLVPGCLRQTLQGGGVPAPQAVTHQLLVSLGQSLHFQPQLPQLLELVVRSISQPSLQTSLQSPQSATSEQPAQKGP